MKPDPYSKALQKTTDLVINQALGTIRDMDLGTFTTHIVQLRSWRTLWLLKRPVEITRYEDTYRTIEVKP